MIFFSNLGDAQTYRNVDTLDKLLSKFKKEFLGDHYSVNVNIVSNRILFVGIAIRLSRTVVNITVIDNPILIRNKIAELKGNYVA